MRFKKILIALGILFGLYAIATYFYFSAEPLSLEHCPITIPGQAPILLQNPNYPDHQFKTINDASCLNETRVYDVLTIKTVDDIYQALKLAREKKLHIAIAGRRHSMGGQSFFKDALVLDMMHFNRIIALDEEKKIITVESGATWHQIQLYLHPKNLAVKAMQSTDIFTVGGSLAVNAHGMDHTIGSMISTVKSFTIMLADGSIRRITPEQPELFDAVIGGYGLFGIILEVELEVTDNVMYERDTTILNYHDFPEFFEKITQEKTYGLFYAHLSTSPLSFFKDMIIYGYKKIEHEGPFKPLGKISLINLRRFLINLSKRRHYAQVFKWIAEKYIDPAIDKLRTKNLVSRNEIMHDSVEYLENVLINETDILHEYFIPHKNFIPYIDQMRTILKNSKIPVLNASIRIINKESNMLNYAPEDMFAIVLYLNQRVDTESLQAMKKLTSDLIDLTLKFDGTFFLPYQLHYTREQLQKAYPNINTFFALKRKYDPSLLFMNNFYAKYAQ
ncbi:FAD-binding oxidoreductase [soil metagenome]